MAPNASWSFSPGVILAVLALGGAYVARFRRVRRTAGARAAAGAPVWRLCCFLGAMGPVVYMSATRLFVGALGMGLAFAPTALYPYYVHHARVWGLSAGDDQSLAGALMAVEQSLVMGTALVVLFLAALSESEREQQRRERYETA